MPVLFESTSINGMQLANRFVRSGTATGMANPDGSMTPKLSAFIADVAKGGVGLVIPDFFAVLKNGRLSLGQVGLFSDEFIPELTRMADGVHAPGSKVVAQIVHCGAHSDPRCTGEEPMGPSAMPKTAGKFGEYPGCREMTGFDIENVVEGFRMAANRAKKAGFDGVQLHCAHGYVLSEFLSPFYNKRTDSYGGSITNRARIVVETYQAVRREVGSKYPILIKMNVTDFLDDGITPGDAFQAARIFAGMGIDAIELSGGTSWGFSVLGDINRFPTRTVKDEGYYRDMAMRLKEALDVPIILTGGIRSYATAQQFVHDNMADYIGLCRPLIREPGLINRWKSGDTRESGCISDNGCLFAIFQGKDLQCVNLAKE